MTATHTQFPDHHVTLHHDEAAQPDPGVMVWFMHGVSATVHRNPEETAPNFWLRVLAAINDERLRLTSVRSLLDPLAPCHVYAGALEPACLAALKKRHMRQFILGALQREGAAPAATGATGASRTKALTLLAKLTGIGRPRRKVIKSETLPVAPSH